MNAASRTALRDEKITEVKREILNDVADGRVPDSVQSFGELHDYVDANCYGCFCDEDESARLAKLWNVPRDELTASQSFMDFVNEIQDAVDAWICTGGITDQS